MAYVRLERKLPSRPPHTSKRDFNWITPPPSERTCFMDDPLHSLHCDFASFPENLGAVSDE